MFCFTDTPRNDFDIPEIERDPDVHYQSLSNCRYEVAEAKLTASSPDLFNDQVVVSDG